DGLADAITRPASPGAVAHVAAELRREHDTSAAAVERRAEERLAAALVPVDVGRVEERHAGVERSVDDGTRSVLVDPHAEVVAAEADDRDLRSFRSQPPRSHTRRC